MTKRAPTLLVALLASGLIAAGCGDDESSESASAGTTAMESSQTTSAEPGAMSDAATLRADLTYLLDEHVYLAGIAIKTGVDAGLDSKEFEAAAGSLDENSKGLAGAIGGLYGEEAGDQFLALWRDHIGFFVDYTEAKAGGDDAAAMRAERKLDGYRSEFGAFINSAVPSLPADAVAEELTPHVESVFAAIDSVVAGRADAFDKLREAAGHMPNTAKVLAAGIAAEQGDMVSGSVDAGASELRAALTAALTEHVYLAGIAITQGAGEGLDSKPFEAAAGTLDANSKALADAIGSVYGDDAGKQFLALWRDHIGFFVDYTEAKAGGDDAAADRAVEKLDGYRAEFGAFIESANENLPADAVAEELVPHVESVLATIDAVVAGDPALFELLREAASHMPGTAATLADGIAKQQPDMFGAN